MSDLKHEKVAEKYVEMIKKYDNLYPYVTARKLAQIICEEEKLDLDHNYFRHAVSAYRSNSVPIEPIDEVFGDEPDLELPESYYEPIEPFKLPKSISKLLILSDIHIPYQDNNALRIAIKYGKAQGVDAILLNGDIADMYAVSFHERDHDKRDLNIEIKEVQKFLSGLRIYFPNTKIYYKIGNHEARYIRYLNGNAPEVASMANLAIESILNLKEYDISLIEHLRIVEAGKLNIGHGDEFRGGGTINVARNILLRSFDNVLVGHFHKTNEEIAPKLGGESLGSWSVGCLCGLKAPYMPINRWNHGFCLVDIEDNGSFTVHNKKIVGGVVR